MLVEYIPERDRHGEIVGWFATILDITERKNAEKALRKIKEELEDKVRERTAEFIKINESLLREIEEHKLTEKRLKTARNNLRAMASEIVLADERSRQHFATDLHDTVVQTMGAAKLRSQLIQDKIPEDVKPVYSELQDLLSQSITQARLIMAEMSPPVLYELGFAPALEWLTEQIERQHEISIEFQTKSSPPMVHEIQVMLFQSTRELLMNVVKHARAKTAVVILSADQAKIKIEVKDDGRGFDARQAFCTDVSGGGFGLFSIRERLRHFGGELHLRSIPGRGTKAVMAVPRMPGKYS